MQTSQSLRIGKRRMFMSETNIIEDLKEMRSTLDYLIKKHSKVWKVSTKEETEYKLKKDNWEEIQKGNDYY